MKNERAQELREQWTRESEGPYDVLDAGPDILELLNDREELLQEVAKKNRLANENALGWSKAVQRIEKLERVVEAARDVLSLADALDSEDPVIGERYEAIERLTKARNAIRHYDEAVKG